MNSAIYVSVGSAITAVGVLAGSLFLNTTGGGSLGKDKSTSVLKATQVTAQARPKGKSARPLTEILAHKDWLLGLPPQIAEHIVAALDEDSLAAMRLVSKSTYAHLAARTTKLSLCIDGSPCVLTGAHISSVYPRLQELQLVPCGPRAAEALNMYLTTLPVPQLSKLAGLDLSLCAPQPMTMSTWHTLTHALGAEAVLRMPWRCLPGSAEVSTATIPYGAGAAACMSETDAIALMAPLQLFAAVRPGCLIELEGSKVPMPVRSAASLQALTAAAGQLRALPLSLAGIRPLSHHVGWLSCLRSLTSLEVKYREEGDQALTQVLRALQPPIPLVRLVTSRVNHLVGEPDLALLAQLPNLQCLEVAGIRVMHGVTEVCLRGITRLAVRTERLDLMQPLASIFPALLDLELGYGSEDAPTRTTWTGAAGAAAALPASLQALAAVTVPTAASAGSGGGAGLPGGAAGTGLQQGLGGQGSVVLGAAGGLPGAAGAGGGLGGGGGGVVVMSEGPELTLHLRPLAGLGELSSLTLGGRPGQGVEALATLTSLTRLVLRRCSEFRPLRKAVEELRSIPSLQVLEVYACVGGEACGYEIARLLRRLQKLPSLARCILDGCDQRLAQQLATAPLTRLSQLVLLRLHDLTPLDLLYIAQAQSSVRQMLVRECAKLSKAICVDLPRAANRPLLQMLT